MSIVAEYWQGVAQRLQIEADVFNRLIKHNATGGVENEASLAEVLARLLPPTVGVGSGIVIDSAGRRSKQTDMIIFDQSTQPNVLAQTSQMIYPIETVRLVIEVKTSVTSDEIEDVAEKVEVLNTLQSQTTDAVPYALFGYSCASAPATIVKNLSDLDEGRAPTLACVMRPGIYSNRREGLSGLVPLHEQDDDGQPQSQTWVKPTDPRATNHSVGASLYPVMRLGANSREKVVGNPGRALLLFCSALLSCLADSDNVRAHWLEHYLPSTARELIAPVDQG